LRAPARVVDLTCDLFNGMPTYPGDPPFRHQFVIRGSRDGEVTLSRVESGLHSGTHVDAPLHFIPGGDSVDRVSPARLVVLADLVDLTSKGPGQPITRDDLMGRVRPGRAAVLYTGFSALEPLMTNWCLKGGSPGYVGIPSKRSHVRSTTLTGALKVSPEERELG